MFGNMSFSQPANPTPAQLAPSKDPDAGMGRIYTCPRCQHPDADLPEGECEQEWCSYCCEEFFVNTNDCE